MFEYSSNSSFCFLFLSYPNVGLDKDPPYAYKDKTDNYDSPLNAQRVTN